MQEVSNRMVKVDHDVDADLTNLGAKNESYSMIIGRLSTLTSQKNN
jgi:hypothetical protein